MTIRPVFGKRESNWIDILPTITKQYNIKHTQHNIRHTAKLTPVQASLNKNEGYVYNNLLNKRRRVKPKLQINDLGRTAELQKTFSNSDTINWSYKLCKITAILNDTIPSYKIDKLEERYNEALLKKTELTMKENDSVMKKLNLS